MALPSPRLSVLSAVLALAAVVALAPGRPAAAVAPTGVLDSRPLVSNGDPAHRITLVLLGDGYTAAELPAYRAEATAVWRALTAIEPFRTYQRFLDVQRVDLASPASGLRSGSPLGMHFGCGGVARLLCADEGAVARYAGPAAGSRCLLALGNTSRYGGEGGGGMATLAAGSPQADRILQHEMGHAIGGLGDEYDAAPADAGPPNLAGQDADTMRRERVKWWRWLGAADPGGGPVGAYRSGNGLYRPTRDSVMRTLGGVYNLPSREALIEAFYRQVRPIDRSTPDADAVELGAQLQVFPVPLVGARQLAVAWTVDGRPAPARAVADNRLDTSRLGLAPGGRAQVEATVQDTTPWVRDEDFRRVRMTERVDWTVGD